MSEVLLKGEHIGKSFGRRAARRQALNDVSVEVHAGECLAVIGGSGSGKSTLTRILLGLLPADSGTVTYLGADVTAGRRAAGYETLRQESGLVFQDPFSSLDPRWTVMQSVAEPLRLRHRNMPRDVVLRRVAGALRDVSLDPETFAGRYPVDLSGGQAQRVAIARAIVNEPRVILADEPMSAIDVAARVQILDTFAAIRERQPEMALILVSHDLGVVRHIADRIVVLHDGKLEEEGPTEQLLSAPTCDYTRRLIDAATVQW